MLGIAPAWPAFEGITPPPHPRNKKRNISRQPSFSRCQNAADPKSTPRALHERSNRGLLEDASAALNLHHQTAQHSAWHILYSRRAASTPSHTKRPIPNSRGYVSHQTSTNTSQCSKLPGSFRAKSCHVLLQLLSSHGDVMTAAVTIA